MSIAAEKLYISVEEAAKILNVHRNTVYGWVTLGRIPYFRNGTTIRIPVAEFEQWRRDNTNIPER